MIETIFNITHHIPFFGSLPPFLQVFVIGLIPIIELRGAIPFGVFVLKMNLPDTIFWAVAGNMVPNALILYLMPIMEEWARQKFNFVDKFLVKLHDNHAENFKKTGMVFLVLFIGVPIPGSGSYTGCLLAYLFGLSFRRGLVVVTLGVLVAACVVSAAVFGLFNGIECIYNWG